MENRETVSVSVRRLGKGYTLHAVPHGNHGYHVAFTAHKAFVYGDKQQQDSYFLFTCDGVYRDTGPCLKRAWVRVKEYSGDGTAQCDTDSRDGNVSCDTRVYKRNDSR